MCFHWCKCKLYIFCFKKGATEQELCFLTLLCFTALLWSQVGIADSVAIAAQNLHLSTVSSPTDIMVTKTNLLTGKRKRTKAVLLSFDLLCLSVFIARLSSEVMQIVARLASIFNTFCALFKMTAIPSFCWHYPYHNNTLQHEETCPRIKATYRKLQLSVYIYISISYILSHLQGAHMHFYSESAIFQVALFVISMTLAAYCCKLLCTSSKTGE